MRIDQVDQQLLHPSLARCGMRRHAQIDQARHARQLRAHAFDVIHQTDRDAIFIQMRIDAIGLCLAHCNQHAYAAQRCVVVHAGHQIFFQLAPQCHEGRRLQRHSGLQPLAEIGADADRYHHRHQVQQRFVDLLLISVGNAIVGA